MLHPSTHLLLHCGAVLGCQRGRLGELDLPVRAGNEHPVDYTAMKVDMRIQRAAEALHETHRPQPPARAATTLARPRFDHPQDDVQHGADRLGFVLQKIAHRASMGSASVHGVSAILYLITNEAQPVSRQGSDTGIA